MDQERRALNRVSVGTVDGKHGRCNECSREYKPEVVEALSHGATSVEENRTRADGLP